jgi:hypothetical protein
MQVLNISKNGTIKCEMSDGRLGYTYKSGYVRVSCKDQPHFRRRGVKLYQINKKRKHFNAKRSNYYYTRELIYNELDRLRMLYAFDLKNCQNK